MSMIEAEKEARNEKLLKFAGLCPHKWVHFWEIDFKSPEYLYLGGHKGYRYRCVSCGASSMDDTEGLYDFLDEEWGIAHCFKWLVPIITAEKFSHRVHHIGFGFAGDGCLCYLNTEGNPADVTEPNAIIGDGEYPALACAKAIEQLIDSQEVKDE